MVIWWLQWWLFGGSDGSDLVVTVMVIWWLRRW
jgi:hypothetical protein